LYSGFALGFFKRRFFYHLDSAMGIIAVNGVVENIEPQRWCYGLVPDIGCLCWSKTIVSFYFLNLKGIAFSVC
jgi:hypothetical protein